MTVWSTFGRRWAALPNASAAGPILKSYFDTLYVALTGDQTVAGVKTFSSNPVVSGGGIQLPATQVPSADVNALDDYEEGTFTPVITGGTSGGTGTYSIQQGFYTKIGNRVFIQLAIIWTAHTGTGNLLITGLPFTVSGDAAITIANSLLTYTSTPTAIASSSTTQIALYQSASDGARANIAIEAEADLRLAGHYKI
jgi:hypothetical protein